MDRSDWRQATAGEPQARISAFVGHCGTRPPAVVVQVDDPDDEYVGRTYYYLRRRAEVQRLVNELTGALERADRTGMWKCLESIGIR